MFTTILKFLHSSREEDKKPNYAPVPTVSDEIYNKFYYADGAKGSLELTPEEVSEVLDCLQWAAWMSARPLK